MPFYNCRTTTLDIVEIVIEFVIAVPSIVIYALLFRLFHKRKQTRMLNDSFFTLFILSAVMNIAMFIINFIFFRIPGIGIFCDEIMNSPLSVPTYWLTLPYFLGYYLQYSQLLTVVAISFNRMCSVLLTTNFAEIWRSLTPLCIFLILVGPLLFTWQLLFAPVFYSGVNNGLGMDYMKVIKYAKNSLLSLCANLAGAVLVISFTVVTVVRMSTMMRRHKKSEISLLIIGAIQSLGVLLIAAHQLYMTINFSDLLYQKRFILVDFMSFSPAWALLLLSSSVRNRVSSMLWTPSKCEPMKTSVQEESKNIIRRFS